MNQALAPASAGQQQRALWLSTFAFTVCFAVWMIFRSSASRSVNSSA
jgi:NNP family nitrate/nitrite transporter-like MFS transporter